MCPDLNSIKFSCTHLSGQVEQVVFKEHVLGLAPGAVYNDHIMFHCAYFLVLHQLLQVLGFRSWIEDQCPAVPTYCSQLCVSERKRDEGKIWIYICDIIGKSVETLWNQCDAKKETLCTSPHWIFFQLWHCIFPVAGRQQVKELCEALCSPGNTTRSQSSSQAFNKYIRLVRRHQIYLYIILLLNSLVV